MHCSANVGAEDGRVAVFFGLSGTGKTTLSADPDRSLIGDDEHGWSDSGVFNIEGGCYAKVIRLSAEAEPQIWRTTRTFGTILENVAVDEAGAVDLDDDAKTENTRAAYKLERIANALPTKRAGHPSSVVFLAADAFAVLPPIARLSRDQAMYWFLSGFTAKLAGTELGVTEPQPTFSTCFGAPFLPQPPAVYARHARREARPARRERVAREHRLDGRAVRRRPSHADHRHARPPARRPLRRARRRPVPNGSGLRIRGAGLRPGRRQGAPRPARRHGPTRAHTTRRPPSWQRCSARTSRRRSPRTSTRPSPLPAHAPRERQAASSRRHRVGLRRRARRSTATSSAWRSSARSPVTTAPSRFSTRVAPRSSSATRRTPTTSTRSRSAAESRGTCGSRSRSTTWTRSRGVSMLRVRRCSRSRSRRPGGHGTHGSRRRPASSSRSSRSRTRDGPEAVVA